MSILHNVNERGGLIGYFSDGGISVASWWHDAQLSALANWQLCQEEGGDETSVLWSHSAAFPACWPRVLHHTQVECHCNPSEPPSVRHTSMHPLCRTTLSLSLTHTHAHTHKKPRSPSRNLKHNSHIFEHVFPTVIIVSYILIWHLWIQFRSFFHLIFLKTKSAKIKKCHSTPS